MPQCAVEHPAFTIALDPNHAVILVRTDVPLAQVRLLGIDTDKNVQLLEYKCVEFAEEAMYGHLRKPAAK